jgi:3-hydroxyacyl-[acyl-carrier-protein] dehydratase
MKCQLNFEEIKQILPHRYPFLLVDKVVSVTEDAITAIKNVSANEPFFQGHFPDFFVMPGVLQIEAMAQVAGIILTQSRDFDAEKDIAFLASVDEAKFKRPVVPGDQLVIKAQVLAKKRGILKASVSAFVDEELASTATIILVIKPKNV